MNDATQPKRPAIPVSAIEDPIERRRAAALEASKIGVFEYEPQTDTAFWDDRTRELWGITDDRKITYDVVVAHVHPQDLKLHDDSTARALDPAGDGRMDMLYRLHPADGHPMRWIHAVASCFFEDGKAVRLVGTVQDVTQAQEARSRNRLLVNELEHRVKNTLATALAVVRLSREGVSDIATYYRAVDERLRALSVSQDLLRRTDYEAVDFAELLTSVKASFVAPKADRDPVVFDGDPVRIPAKHVMSMTMSLHELFTNAAKYGALSVPGGHVRVGMNARPSTVVLTWEEQGGPPIAQTGKLRRGFGTILLSEILPAEMRATAERALMPEGLRYRLEIMTTGEDFG